MKLLKKISYLYRKFATHWKLLKVLEIRDAIKYSCAMPGKVVLLNILGEQIHVRKSTPDLSVAISCLSGEFDIIKFLLPEDFSGTIIDAGGYIGTSAVAFRQLFPFAKLIVIEPSSENLLILRKNLHSFDNLKIFQGALVGKKTEKITLNNRGTGEWGFTTIPQRNSLDSNIEEVTGYRIQDIISNNEEIGLLKLDIEGAELEILENEQSSLEAIPVILAELHDRIIIGCEQAFIAFSKDRILIKDLSEKYLSIKR